jgi:fibronectin-binding autotransporter adhesin
MRATFSSEGMLQAGRNWFRSALLTAAIAFCLLPSPARAQDESARRHREAANAPTDWESAIALTHRFIDAAGPLENMGKGERGMAYTNPSGAGTINNRAGSLSFGQSIASPPLPPPSTINDDWVGPTTGFWNNGSNWSGGVPNNGGGNIYDVFIDNGLPQATTVTLDPGFAATINNLTIDSDDALVLGDNSTLTINGNISNAGNITISSIGDNTSLVIGGSTVTLSGGGTVTLGSNGPNFILAGTSGNTLVNQETIQGTGNIGDGGGLNLTNSGTIDANVSGRTLTINPGGSASVTNTGTLEAMSGGALQLMGSYTNSNGMITAATGSTVILNGATITGGTLSTSGTGVIDTPNGGAATLNSLTNSGNFVVSDNSTVNISGTINNTGTITLNSVGDNTVLSIGTSATLAGTGTMILGSNGPNFIGGGGTLTNQILIEGTGTVGNGTLTLDNAATIDANVSGRTLLVNPAGTVTNTGTLEATNSGFLELQNSTYNNTGGIITAAAGSTVLLNSATITGGTISTSGTGVVETTLGGTATLNSLTNSGNFVVSDNSTVNISGTINNTGTITLASAGDNTVLSIGGTATLSGGGTVILGTSGPNFIGGSGTLTNQETIQGVGNIGNGTLTLNNDATINANGGGTLTIQPGAGGVTNTSILEATNGGTLQLLNGTFTNTGATIEAIGGTTPGVVLLNGATINGGTLTTTGSGAQSGTIETPNSGTATLNSVINSGNFVVSDASNVTISGTINNSGTITLASAGDNTVLSISGTTTLSGGGTVILGSNGPNFILGTGTLTNQETIQGAGDIGNGSLALNNAATIDANVSGRTLTVNPAGTATNTKTMEATNGGNLALAGTFNNAGGTITAATGSTVTLNGVAITGGTLSTSGTGVVETPNSGTATLNGLTNAGTFDVLDASTLTLVGTINNTGKINVNSAGDNTIVDISGAVTLKGKGTLTLGTSGPNFILGTGTTPVLTNASTIQGTGNIGDGSMGLINTGTIISDNSGTTLTINVDSSGFNNKGKLQVGAGTLMYITGASNSFLNFNSTTDTLTGGTYLVTGTLKFDNAAIKVDKANITLTGASSQIIDQNGNNALLALDDIATGSSFALAGGQNFTTAGNFTNSGTLTIGSGSKFDVSGSLSNFNSGTDTLTGGTYAVSGTLQFTGANIVNNAAKITLTGAGSQIIDQSSNNGLANFAANDSAGSFTLAGGRNFTTAGDFSNAGTMKVSSGTKFTVGGAGIYTQTAGSTTTDGTLTASGGLSIVGGTMFGNEGTLAGNISLSGTSAISPGDGVKKIGMLNINGTYMQGSMASALFDLGGLTSGKFDVINITNAAKLGGNLVVDLVNGFTPVAGDNFDIMNYASETGAFSSESLPVISGDHWLVTIGATDVLLQLLTGTGPVKEEDLGGSGEQAEFRGSYTGYVPPSAVPNSQFDSYTFSNSGDQPAQTPEPSSLLLLGSALMGMGAWSRRQLSKRKAQR